MKAFLVPLAWALAVAAGGCGGDDSTTTATSAPLVSYTRTGGFASMPVSLEVDQDGSATVEAGVDPARESFDVDADEVEGLLGELEAADFGAVDSGEQTGCADCYVYEIVYQGETTSYDESQTVPGSVSTVVAHLTEIAEAHYPPEADQPPIVN
jgi:hypothetical protein